MKTVRIIALHLAYGGVEKAIISMANLFAEKYDVEIISVYNMPDSPAFPLDERVRVRYLLKEIPNREEWKAAVARRAPVEIIKESFKSVRILAEKKRQVRETIKSVHNGVLITTRHEDNLQLSRCGDKNVYKIAQLHHDHGFQKKYVDSFKRHYSNIDAFVLLTPGLADEVREMMGDGSKTELLSIPNFLEHYPAELDMAHREKTLLAVGRLDPVKGFDRLIRCFGRFHSMFPDWKLKIAGEGADRARLENMIAERGLEDAVQLLGRLDSFQVEEQMKKASVFAMTSYSEGFGFVIIEAQSCGLPTVAFDVRVGPGYIITPEEDGLLVPDGDEEAYVEALARLASSEPFREHMAVKARRRSEDFSREKIAGQWFALIGE